tara:strand:- start:75 stop:362 length:288 start_codon:yes stop_codon:yes gene_type:complete
MLGQLVGSDYLQVLHFVKHVELTIKVLDGNCLNCIHTERSLEKFLFFRQNQVQQIFSSLFRQLMEVYKTNLRADIQKVKETWWEFLICEILNEHF